MTLLAFSASQNELAKFAQNLHIEKKERERKIERKKERKKKRKKERKKERKRGSES